MLKCMKVSTIDFLKYIEWRIIKHSKIISSDELEILEVYYSDDDVKEYEETIFIPILEYTLVDKIHFEKNGIKYYHPNFRKVAKTEKHKLVEMIHVLVGAGKNIRNVV